MAISPAVLQGGVALTTSSAAIYTAPSGTKAVIKRAVFTNFSAAAVTVSVTSTRSGGSPLTLIDGQSIPAHTDYIAPELANFVMNTGDALNASCSAAASVNAFAWGYTL